MSRATIDGWVTPSLIEYRQRASVREWYNSFAFSLGKVMAVYAGDVARRERVLRRSIPWKRCPTHAFTYLYASQCPLCLADAHVY